MKAFALSLPQISSVVTALAADELGSKFGRHIDTLTGSNWSADTSLFEGGAGLSVEEAGACLDRAFQFFGHAGAPNPASEASRFGDWAEEVALVVERSLTSFSFSAAGEGAREFAHPADAVFADAAAAANLLYGRRRILSLVSPHSLIGFILSILTPNLLQTPAIDVRGTTPGELTKFLAFGDAVIATPSLWRYLIAQNVFAPDNAMAVLFGEPTTAELAVNIRKAGFGAQREFYGSTENGLIGWRDAPSDPFALFDHLRRNDGGLRRVLPSGKLVEISPMDLLIFEGERRFRLGGRRDGAVQIGAVNVFPARIAERIAEHPEVKTCVVGLSKNSAGTERLVATIELRTAAPPSESTARSIDAWCRSNLRPHERPRLYSFVERAKAK